MNWTTVNSHIRRALTWTAVALFVAELAVGWIGRGEVVLLAIVIVLVFPYRIIDTVRRAIGR